MCFHEISIKYMILSFILSNSIKKMTGIISKFIIFEVIIYNIQAKSIHTQIQPKSYHFNYFISNFWISPIQVGLLNCKSMKIVLLGTFIPFPTPSSKCRHPIIRNLSIYRFFPNIPISFGIIY